MTDRPVWLTTEQLVERWGGAVAHNTIVNWRGRKEGPAWHKIGRQVLYRLDEVEAWERSNRKAAE